MSLYSAHSDLPVFPAFQFISKSLNCPAIGRLHMRMGRQASGGQSLPNGDTGVVALERQRSIQSSPLNEVTAQWGQETGYLLGD